MIKKVNMFTHQYFFCSLVVGSLWGRNWSCDAVPRILLWQETYLLSTDFVLLRTTEHHLHYSTWQQILRLREQVIYLIFISTILFCTHKHVLIFFSSRNPTPALVSDRYTFCQKCFNDITGDSVSLGDDPSQPQV